MHKHLCSSKENHHRISLLTNPQGDVVVCMCPAMWKTSRHSFSFPAHFFSAAWRLFPETTKKFLLYMKLNNLPILHRDVWPFSVEEILGSK